MLNIEGLSTVIARTTILDDVSMEVGRGEIAGLIGRNGAGKTTFMRSIMGLQPLRSGRIHLGDDDLTMLPAHCRAAKAVGYMPEDRRLVPSFTVRENILFPLWATGHADHQQRLEWVFGLMPEVAEAAERKALSLSGGQQKLVALARALICGSRILLLDEPFEGVAPALAQRLAEVATNLQREGLTVVVSESDYTHTVGLLDRLYVIERGMVEERSTSPNG